MTTEKFSNNASTTLNGSILSTDLSLVVTSAASFPTQPQFRIKIEDEILLVTGVSGTTFTVSRGQEGTTAAGHDDDSSVTHVLTAEALTKFQSDTLTEASMNYPGAVPSRRTPIDSNTLVCWNLDETTGPWANTGTAGTLNLTASGTVTSVSGMFFNAVKLLSGAYVYSPDTSTGEPAGNNMTVSFWIRFTSFGNAVAVVKHYYSPASWSSPYTSLMISTSTSTALNVCYAVSSTYIAQTDIAYLSANVWYLLVITCDGTDLKVYLNGDQVGSYSTGGSIDWGQHGAWYLASNVAGQYENCIIDDFRVEETVRSASYIQMMYKNGIGLFDRAYSELTVSPSQITSNQNNYNPTSFGDANTLRLSSDATRTITGFNESSVVTSKTLTNVGSYNIILAHESSSSSASNRILCPDEVDILLPPRKSTRMSYDPVSTRWRVNTGIGTTAWSTSIDIDFKQEATQSLTTDGDYIIAGKTFTKVNSTQDATPMVLTNGVGVVITPVANTEIHGSVLAWTAPGFQLKMTEVTSEWDWATPTRVWIYIASQNSLADYDSVYLTLGRWGNLSTPYVGVISYRGYIENYGQYNRWFDMSSSLNYNFTDQSLYDDNDVLVIDFNAIGDAVYFRCGKWNNGWPPLNELSVTGLLSFTASALVDVRRFGKGIDWTLGFGACRIGSGTNFVATIGALRVDYLK